MTVLRITGGLLITAAGLLSGIYAGSVKKRQREFMRQYIVFLTRAETMISYSNSSIIYILDNSEAPNLMKELLKSMRLRLAENMSLSEAWAELIDEACEKKLIVKKDKELMKLFAEDFGTSGANEEEGKLRLKISLAQERLSELNSETAESTKLYRVIGAFAGALTAVMII